MAADAFTPRSGRLNDCLQRLAIVEAMLQSTRNDLVKEMQTGQEAMAILAQAASSGDMTPEGKLRLSQTLGNLATVDEGAVAEPPLKGKAARDAAHAAAVEDAIRVDGVPPHQVRRFIRKENSEQEACMSLPQTSAMVILSLLACQYHFQFEVLYSMDVAHQFDIIENANFAFSGNVPFENGRMGHKNIDDVHSIADFWSWFTMGLVPIWFPDPNSWGTSEVRGNVGAQCASMHGALDYWGYPAHAIYGASNDTRGVFPQSGAASCPEYDSYMDDVVLAPQTADLRIYDPGDGTSYNPSYRYFNTVVGGVRMRQEQVDNVECPTMPDLENGAVHTGQCTDTYMLYYLKPEKHTSLRTTKELTNKPGGEDVYLLSKWSQGKVLEELRKLENRGWFSPNTNKVELLFATYNPHEGILSATFIIFFHSRTGHIHKYVESVSMWMDPYNDYSSYVLDFFWLFLVLKIFIEETIDVTKSMITFGPRTGFNEYIGFSNAIDWLSIFYAFMIVGMWFAHLANLAELAELMSIASVDVEGAWNYDSDRVSFFQLLHDSVLHLYSFRVVLSMYPFVIIVRFFKAFDAQPRLSMVTGTMKVACVDIIHFLVVFVTIFVIFVFSAFLLFGQEIGEFSNFARAFNTTFRILIGDFDWDEMAQIGRPQAYAWFWLIQWGLNMIMLNMLLGIILDVYSAVRAEILSRKGVETLWSQAAEIYKRKKLVYTGKYVALKKILAILNPDGLESDPDEDPLEEDPVTVEGLRAMIPKMEEDQAVELLTGAVEYFEDNPDDMTIVKDALGRLQDCVDALCATNKCGGVADL